MKTIWVLTLVKRGFIQEPEIFYDEFSANNRKKALMADFNPDYDELGLFRKQIAL